MVLHTLTFYNGYFRKSSSLAEKSCWMERVLWRQRCQKSGWIYMCSTKAAKIQGVAGPRQLLSTIA